MLNAGRIETLKHMLENEPGDLFLNYALGMEYLNVSETLPLAKEQFLKTLMLNSEYVPAFYQLGKLCELLQQREEALTFYQKGLELARIQKNNKAINEFGEALFMLED